MSIVLVRGRWDEDDSTAYIPEITLEHVAGWNELHVLVDGEAAGLVEGVSPEAWERIVRRLS